MRNTQNPQNNSNRTNYSVLIKPAGPDCNLNCSYCFYLQKSELFSDTKIHRMSIETLEKMVSEMMQHGGTHPNFLWQGGEPTLMGLDFFKRAIEFQQKYGRSGQHVSNALQTNGLLIDDDWAGFLHEYSFLIGLSLDGPQAIHDRYRRSRNGKGSHHLVMRAADIFRKYNVEFNILCLINDLNVCEPEKLYEYYIANDFRYLQFIPAIELDSDDNVAPFCPTPGKYGRFLSGMFDRWYNNGQPEIYIRTFEDILHVYYGLEAPSCIFRKTCGDYIVMEHNGQVYSCDFFVDPEHLLGDISTDSLVELFDCERQKRFGKSKSNLPPECTSCEYVRYCYGGCLKERVFCSDRNLPRSNYFCAAYKKFFAHADSRFKELAQLVKEREQEAALKKQKLAALNQWRARNPGVQPGRNDPCPCGSGKKFKKCCQELFFKNIDK